MIALRNLIMLVGRVLIAAIFIYDGILVAQSPGDVAGYMQSFGVPGPLLWPTAAFEFLGGLAIAFGFLTRLAGFGLAVFCLMTALIFHRNWSDMGELIQFGKDIGLAGGFLFLFANGAGGWSIDARLGIDAWPFGRT